MKNKKEKNININFKLYFSSISEKKINIVFIIFLAIFHKVISKTNTISIKVNTAGGQRVLRVHNNNAPTAAFINDIEVEIDSDYALNVISTNDIIKLSWSGNIYDCSFMFEDLNNILLALILVILNLLQSLIWEVCLKVVII